jgi:hypothetical protein
MPRSLVAVILALTIAGCANAPATAPREGSGPTSGSGSAPTPHSTSAPTPLPGAATPASVGPVAILSSDELRAAITETRNGAADTRDVITTADIDPGRKTAPLVRECAWLGQCTVIGTLAGIDPADGTVTVATRDQSPNLPPPTTPADLHGPVALRLNRVGPIEFLGHATPGPSGVVWDVAAASGTTTSAPNGEVIAVDGWLTSYLTSCGPAPMPLLPPVPQPFGCYPPGDVFANADGSGPTVKVQTFAYLEFATDPDQTAANGMMPPRQGVYLVRMVVYDAVNCHQCRGWLMVGRMDAPQPFRPVPTDLPTIRSAAELAASLASGRGALVGRIVFVDGPILPGSLKEPCSGDALCSIGQLVGTSERVRATAYTASLLLPDTDFPTHGVLTLVVQPEGVEYLGFLGLNNGVNDSGVFPIAALRDALVGSSFSRGPLTAIAKGWLVGDSYPCPGAAPGLTTPPPDTPFVDPNCPSAWLTPVAEQPMHISGNTTAFTDPTDGVTLQVGAYERFAANPEYRDDIGPVARFGTYVLRQVQDHPDQPDTQRGWQMVGRLDP